MELLIGTNAPKIMEPLEAVNSCENGPYAVRTLLRWVVTSPLRIYNNEDKSHCPSVTANRISVSNLEEMLISKYNTDFNEKSYEEKK